jgi:hypothetical protein
MSAVLLAAMPAGRAATPTACAYLAETMAHQPGAAVLLASYPDAPPGPLKQAAFVYDNAVAAIALFSCGQPAQARRIGDALLLALDHDRYWRDGRLRNGYAAGGVSAAPIQLAGWWDSKAQRWLEDDYQAGSDSGNLAWAMLALLTLDQQAGGRYAHGAARIARWLEPLRDRRGAGGFTGGSFGSEAAQRPLLWKSTEHNADLAAAFARFAAASGDAHWLALSQAAAAFVDAMWDAPRGAFAAGTAQDGVTRNPLLALDAQVWPLLALPGAVARYGEVVTHGLQRLRTDSGGAAGYAYSDAGVGLWTEGTAQVTLLERLSGHNAARAALAAIETARVPGGGYYATTVPALPTGFMLDTDPTQPRAYLHLEHLGAAAWVALEEQGFNPFTGNRRLPP